MLDPNLLRNKLEIVAEKLARRKYKIDVVTLQQWEKRRKLLQTETENLQAERNLRSKEFGIAKCRGDNTKQLYQTVNQLRKRLNIIKIELNILQDKIRNYSLSLPNIPDDDVPNGIYEEDNLEILQWGKPHKYNFPIRDHVMLGEITGGFDFAAAIKLSGARFVVMRGQIARLHRALAQFMLDIHTEHHGYVEYYLPYIANKNSLYGTGQLPKFIKELFHVQSIEQDNNKKNNNLYALIPTAEVPLTNLMRGEIINEDMLPLKMTAYTPCFRSEAGSHRIDTRGIIRMHQFDKVEIVQIVEPTQSMYTLEVMTNHAEKVLQLLKLPYRKMLLCAGNMSFSSCKTYDLEVWFPSQKSYREISSCSNIGDFQARRMKTRYRSRMNKKPKLVHTLNGSGLAVGRTLAAILENYQQADGSIIIPEVLRPYMKWMTHI